MDNGQINNQGIKYPFDLAEPGQDFQRGTNDLDSRYSPNEQQGSHESHDGGALGKTALEKATEETGFQGEQLGEITQVASSGDIANTSAPQNNAKDLPVQTIENPRLVGGGAVDYEKLGKEIIEKSDGDPADLVKNLIEARSGENGVPK